MLKRCIRSSCGPAHYLIPLYFLPLQETLCLSARSPHSSSLPQLLTTTHPLPVSMDLSVLHTRANTIIKYVLFLYSFPPVTSNNAIFCKFGLCYRRCIHTLKINPKSANIACCGGDRGHLNNCLSEIPVKPQVAWILLLSEMPGFCSFCKWKELILLLCSVVAFLL